MLHGWVAPSLLLPIPSSLHGQYYHREGRLHGPIYYVGGAGRGVGTLWQLVPQSATCHLLIHLPRGEEAIFAIKAPRYYQIFATIGAIGIISLKNQYLRV